MDQKFSRSRSLRYRSGRSRASRVASQHVEKTVADSSSMTVVASEGGAIASVHVSSSSDDSVLENLRSELHEACKERLKAAEYGLVLLEEKEFLQQEVDRLEVQYESSRHEVDILNQQLQDAKSETAYFKQQVSAFRTDLVEECDRREDALVEDTKSLLHQLAAVKRSLKLETEQRKLLELETEKLKLAEESLRRELVTVRQQSNDENQESRALKKTNVQLQMRLVNSGPSNASEQALLDEVSRLEKENSELLEEVNALSEELDALQPEDSDDDDNDDSGGGGAPQTTSSISRQSLCSGGTDSGTEHNMSSPGGIISPSGEGHSPEKLSQSREMNAEQLRSIDCSKFSQREVRRGTGRRHAINDRQFEQRERELLRQASLLRAELVAALTELDGLRSMSSDSEAAAMKQISRLQEELELVQQREREMRQQTSAHEEQLYNREKTAGQSEDVLSHLGAELRSLNADLVKVGRLASSLGDLKKKKQAQPDVDMHDTEATKWNSNIQLLGNIRQQVRSVKSALDTLLMQSLQKTAAKIGLSGSQAEVNMCDERKESLQDDLRKAQQQLTAKTHESNQLRSLLKMARLTATANVDREKSAREQQVMSLQLKISALEKHIEKLRQDSRECAQERNTFQVRCDEYIAQLARHKKEGSALRDETKLLDGMLTKAISQKLALTEKLENYDLELQQLQQKDQIKEASVTTPPKATPTAKLMSSRLRFMRNHSRK